MSSPVRSVLRCLVSCVVAGVLLAGLMFPAAGAIGAVVGQADTAVDDASTQLVEGRVPLMTTITDAQGAPIAFLAEQFRVRVGSEAVADTIKAAIIAIEDRRFFSHNGVDWQGTTRAMVSNLARSGSAFQGQGGSTITMQYVKNYRLYAVADSGAERDRVLADTVARKLREARVAMRLEQQLTKQEILTRYLNLVYFGNGAYGIAAATRTYFDTGPEALTVAQAALLAGLVRSPTAFDPVSNPEAALARRGVVIDAMLDVGSIDAGQAAAAKAQPLGIVDPLVTLQPGCAGAEPATGFFCKLVVDRLVASGMSIADLRSGGYVITTTLDRRASELADTAAEDLVPVDGITGIANAIAVVAPGTEQHRVLALAANRDFGFDGEAGQTAFPIPSAPVPFGAGSIYKIFTAAAAMERGLGIQDTIPVPDVYTSREFENGSEPYTVENAGDYPSELTLQQALSESPNTAFVALEDRIGSVDPIVDMAYRLGMRTSLAVPAGPDRTVGEAVKAEERGSFTLGPEPTSPLDLANVAATLMSGGVWCPPTVLDSVTDRAGRPVSIERAPCEQAVPTGLADTLVVGMSEDTITGTGAAAASAAGWERPMLGKTGTTQESVSSGFVGATPQFAASVMTWSDAPPPRSVCVDPPQLCSDGNLFGGTIPARTWFAAMQPLHEGLPVAPLPEPDPDYV